MNPTECWGHVMVVGSHWDAERFIIPWVRAVEQCSLTSNNNMDDMQVQILGGAALHPPTHASNDIAIAEDLHA